MSKDSMIDNKAERGLSGADLESTAADSAVLLFKEYGPLTGQRLDIMDADGRIVNDQWLPEMSDEQIVKAYETMLYARIADLKAVSYQRQGRLYTLPTNVGQEAAAVGSAMALTRNDWLVPAYRELGAWLVHGCTMKQYFLFFGGSEEGSRFDDGVKMLPSSVPIASQLVHAAGLGHASNYRGLNEVALVYFGDGATSQGDFHESMNWATVFNCPTVFFCNNNGYAISLKRSQQTKATTLAHKALAYGMPSIQVDGNDFFAVFRATSEAVAHARAGLGPVMIEAVTYRRGAHTTSDDPTRYRTSEEEQAWEARDPIIRLRTYLESKKLWDETRETKATADAKADIDKQFAECETHGPTPLEDTFKYQHAEMPDSLNRQMIELKNYFARKDG